MIIFRVLTKKKGEAFLGSDHHIFGKVFLGFFSFPSTRYRECSMADGALPDPRVEYLEGIVYEEALYGSSGLGL